MKITFHDTSCELCGSTERISAGSVEHRNVTYQFHICINCGLCYMSPRPDKDYLMWLYKNIFWEMKTNKGTFGVKMFKHPRLLLNKLLNKGLQDRVQKQADNAQAIVGPLEKNFPLGPSTRILEIGSSFGETLNILKSKYGCMVQGVEPSKKAAKYAQKHGIDTIEAYAEDIPVYFNESPQFDIVIMSHVLENLCHPSKFIKQIKHLISQSGILFINTPNLYYQDSRNPFHNFIFSPESLTLLLGTCGFKVIPQRAEHNATQNHAAHFSLISQPDNEYSLVPERVNHEAILTKRTQGIPNLKAHRVLTL